MTTAERYAPGGDLYQEIAAKHGNDSAQRVFLASQSGETGAIATALGEIRHGPTGSTSTAAILFDQLTTDPLGAPLEAANRTLGNTFFSFLRAPWVLILIAVLLVAYFWPFFRRFAK